MHQAFAVGQIVSTIQLVESAVSTAPARSASADRAVAAYNRQSLVHGAEIDSFAAAHSLADGLRDSSPRGISAR